MPTNYAEVFEELLVDNSTTLDLGAFSIGDIGAQLLVNKLLNNQSLENLYLFDNELTELSTPNIVQLLTRNKLKVIQLYSNPLGSQGIARIIQSLIDKENKSLTHLGLGDTLAPKEARISDNAVIAITRLIKNNKSSIVKIDLSNTLWRNNAIKQLANSLAFNDTLQGINIASVDVDFLIHHTVSEETLKHVADKLIHNYTLQQFIIDPKNPDIDSLLQRNKVIARILSFVISCESIEQTKQLNVEELLNTLTKCVPELLLDQHQLPDNSQVRKIKEVFNLLAGLSDLRRGDSDKAVNYLIRTTNNLLVIANEAYREIVGRDLPLPIERSSLDTSQEKGSSGLSPEASREISDHNSHKEGSKVPSPNSSPRRLFASMHRFPNNQARVQEKTNVDTDSVTCFSSCNIM
jgi:hypothetical protein